MRTQSDFLMGVNQVCDQQGDDQQDQPDNNSDDRRQVNVSREKVDDVAEATRKIRFSCKDQKPYCNKVHGKHRENVCL